MIFQMLTFNPLPEASGNVYCPVTGVCLFGPAYSAPSPASVMMWCGGEVQEIVPAGTDDDLVAAWSDFQEESESRRIDEEQIFDFLSTASEELLPGNYLLCSYSCHVGGSSEIEEFVLLDLDYVQEEA